MTAILEPGRLDGSRCLHSLFAYCEATAAIQLRTGMPLDPWTTFPSWIIMYASPLLPKHLRLLHHTIDYVQLLAYNGRPTRRSDSDLPTRENALNSLKAFIGFIRSPAYWSWCRQDRLSFLTRWFTWRKHPYRSSNRSNRWHYWLGSCCLSSFVGWNLWWRWMAPRRSSTIYLWVWCPGKFRKG